MIEYRKFTARTLRPDQLGIKLYCRPSDRRILVQYYIGNNVGVQMGLPTEEQAYKIPPTQRGAHRLIDTYDGVRNLTNQDKNRGDAHIRLRKFNFGYHKTCMYFKPCVQPEAIHNRLDFCAFIDIPKPGCTSYLILDAGAFDVNHGSISIDMELLAKAFDDYNNKPIADNVI